MARSTQEPARDKKAVFLNVPYDNEFVTQFLAYFCAICAHGLIPRATLELQGGTRRLDRVITLIESCSYSIHDLSRVELDLQPPPTPRFNMPFELGLTVLHAARSPSAHAWFLFEAMDWRVQKSLSDLNGTDAYIHGGTTQGIFREMAKAFVREDKQPTVSQMELLYTEVANNLPQILDDAAAKNPFNARAFQGLVIYTMTRAQEL
jgi:hypothetical protein